MHLGGDLHSTCRGYVYQYMQVFMNVLVQSQKQNEILLMTNN